MGETQSDRAEIRRYAAALRFNRLEELRARLASGEKLTPDDLDDAARRLAEARRRAFEAAG